ncbi:MAG: metallophosphoesterase family protein [Gemmataceae bacterium]|nr:metallophosphoesterase family protein [Gemmataceae bacterium]
MNPHARSWGWILLSIGLLSSTLGFGSALVHGHDDDATKKPQKFPDKLVHRPTPIPDRIILTWTGDPARSQAVTWRTDTSVPKALAQIALAEAGPKFVTKARSIPAVTTPLTTDLNEAHYHTAVFDQLVPRTKYVYRVGAGVDWSEWIHFQTASDQPEPFSFIYFGDAQNDLKAHWSRVIREAYSDMPKARFIIHAGDLINRANRDAEWGEWFAAGGWVNAMVPTVPSPGNHEYEKAADGKRQLSRHWRPQFALPPHGPDGLVETVYYLDYQGVRLVSLNSNEEQARQVAWLDRVLGDNPNRWTVLTFHHPIYSAANDRDNPQLRRLWQPVFDKHHVDLVLTGHDHTYGRSGLLTAEHNVPTGTSVRDPKSGTVYVVSVSGPKLYKLNSHPWMRKSAADTQLYQIITVDGSTLRYQARTATGQLYDAFELRKRPGQANELIERDVQEGK